MLRQVAPAIGPVITPVFRDADGTGLFFSLGINTNGQLTTAPASLSLSAINFIRLWDASEVSWVLAIRPVSGAGIIVTSDTCMPPFSGSVAVGDLLTQHEGYPTPVQPGGAGTVVTAPTQTTDEHTGDFFPGCSHSIRSWDIRIRAVNGCLSALICCPLCQYVQRIITPASDLNSDSNAIIFA